MTEPARTRVIAALLVVVGLLRVVGDLAGVPALVGIGAAWGASPAPKVFSAADGYETFSTRFFLEWTDLGGERRTLALTPELYKNVRGPYPRRNVYGAAIAYGPVLHVHEATRPLLASVMDYALCGEAPLLYELGIDPASVAGRVRVRFEPLPGTDLAELPRRLEPDCR